MKRVELIRYTAIYSSGFFPGPVVEKHVSAERNPVLFDGNLSWFWFYYNQLFDGYFGLSQLW
ncbi:hypothetical protein AC626_01795 [Pseudoalteromonas rubra]|uniref:Uncharacterized protein n=1 Tax=Pseudoalteromonas rubra TaxID=43658 RepID=A0A0L0EYS4_9GAMM|nr:hypothetical protein AC626_01795 [Pseudoalteromonas rubra]